MTVSIQVVFKGFRPAAAAEPRVQRGLSFELPLRVWFLIAIVGCEIQSPYNHERLELGFCEPQWEVQLHSREKRPLWS